MAVKAMQAKNKSRQLPKRSKKQGEPDVAALYAKIENDPNAPQALKAIVEYRRKREKTGEPYLTIEQILAELERD